MKVRESSSGRHDSYSFRKVWEVSGLRIWWWINLIPEELQYPENLGFWEVDFQESALFKNDDESYNPFQLLMHVHGTYMNDMRKY